MGVLTGALRSLSRPLSSSSSRQFALGAASPLLSTLSSASSFASGGSGARVLAPAAFSPFYCSRILPLGRSSSTSTGGLVIGSLTDIRYPKRRLGFKPRRKRSSLRPPGPYAWVKYVPGEPIPSSRPNKGSVQGRKRKKRIAQRKAFILSEKKKRKAQFAEARKKKANERIERKMAAVAREKAWAQRLVELQQLEAQKKAAMA